MRAVKIPVKYLETKKNVFSFLKCFTQGVVAYGNTDMLYYIGITKKVQEMP